MSSRGNVVGRNGILIDKTFDKFLPAGDFNIEETDPIMSEFLFKNDSKNLVQQKTCFKSTNNPSCIDLLSPIVPEVSKIQQLLQVVYLISIK